MPHSPVYTHVAAELLMRAAARIHILHPVRVVLVSAAVLIAVLAMPKVLNIAAKSFSKFPAHSCISALSRQLKPVPINKANTPASAASPFAAKSFGGGPNMSTQVYKYRDPVVFNARDKHTGTVIMLHGLGDSGDGWAPVGAEWAPELTHCKFVFPHAPNRPISVNFGMRMPGWYDIASLEDIDQREDKDGLHESKRYIEALIQQEIAAGIPSDRVVVAGFSQGGAVALMALRSEHKLAGVVGLSTYLPLRKEPPIISQANMQTPIFQAHGDSDYTVAYKFGVNTHNMLKEAGANITFKTYNGMAHGACPEEIAAVGNFLKQVLPQK